MVQLDPLDVLATHDTLSYLLNNPDVLKGGEHKQTRALIHKLYAVLNPSGATPAAFNHETELIAALRNRDHERARGLLATIKTPKLGSLQRWVRECDAANVPDPKDPQGWERQQAETWKTLEAIVRTTMPKEASEESDQQTLVRFKPWEARLKQDEERIPIWRLVNEKRIVSSEEALQLKSQLRVLTSIPGPDRKPPNLHPAIIWTSTPLAIPLTPPTDPETLQPLEITKTPLPQIPNSFILQNVLSPETCRLIIGAGETVGFTPDQAVSGSATELVSVLAHNFYWMADEAFNTALFERVRPFLPPTVAGRPLRTLNRRYRCYRYVPGSVYRPHVDGAWPPSGIDPATGAYVYDATAGQATREYSRFTFLVYLNDEFEGGETTYFVPSVDPRTAASPESDSAAKETLDGAPVPAYPHLQAHPIRPVQGSIVVFPHGDTAGSLVHEGTGVIKGAKYIIRTDVVYEIPKTGRSA